MFVLQNVSISPFTVPATAFSPSQQLQGVKRAHNITSPDWCRTVSSWPDPRGTTFLLRFFPPLSTIKESINMMVILTICDTVSVHFNHISCYFCFNASTRHLTVHLSTPLYLLLMTSWGSFHVLCLNSLWAHIFCSLIICTALILFYFRFSIRQPFCKYFLYIILLYLVTVSYGKAQFPDRDDLNSPVSP